MSDNKAKNKESESGRRIRKRICSVAIVILALAIGCYVLLKTGLLDSQSVDEQLAAIEAAHAIPDAENAAIIYNQLLENYDESVFSPNFLSSEVDNLTRRQPWLSKDYPELAEWLEDRQDIISTLLEASEKEKCRFPIIINHQQMGSQVERISAMRTWAFLLSRAVNNDIAEGRIDAGIQKCNCLVQMGKHLCQQPVLLDYMVGIAFEALALKRMNTFILEGDISEKHLKTLEAAIPQTKDDWAGVSSKIIEFETLFERKNVSFFNKVRYWRLWRQFGSTVDIVDQTREHYLRQLADCRGSRILIALRRYRNTSGRWPETLDDVKSLAPAEIFVDPINGGSFVYKLDEENFTLYSKGENNIDEGGKYDNESGADDWLIWPTSSRKAKKENADTEQSSTQKDVEK